MGNYFSTKRNHSRSRSSVQTQTFTVTATATTAAIVPYVAPPSIRMPDPPGYQAALDQRFTVRLEVLYKLHRHNIDINIPGIYATSVVGKYTQLDFDNVALQNISSVCSVCPLTEDLCAKNEALLDSGEYVIPLVIMNTIIIGFYYLGSRAEQMRSLTTPTCEHIKLVIGKIKLILPSSQLTHHDLCDFMEILQGLQQILYYKK